MLNVPLPSPGSQKEEPLYLAESCTHVSLLAGLRRAALFAIADVTFRGLFFVFFLFFLFLFPWFGSGSSQNLKKKKKKVT